MIQILLYSFFHLLTLGNSDSEIDSKLPSKIEKNISSNSIVSEQKEPDLNGTWEGVFTQKGGYKEFYKVTIKIEQKGSKVQGTTLAYIDELKATLSFTGEILNGKYLSFTENAFLNSDDLGNQRAWCKKSVALQIKRVKGEYVLEGIWAGKSTFGNCEPGTVIMKKAPERV